MKLIAAVAAALSSIKTSYSATATGSAVLGGAGV